MEDAINVLKIIIIQLIVFAFQKNQVVYIKREYALCVDILLISMKFLKHVESMGAYRLFIADAIIVNFLFKSLTQEYAKFHTAPQLKIMLA